MRIAVLAIVLVAGTSALWGQQARPRPQSWVDCELFDGVVTPATFDPGSDPFDELYAGTSFRGGAPLISESKPGDADYNGGRWHLNVLGAGVPADKYADACTVGDLDLSDFQSTDNYFECPLLPSTRGRNGEAHEKGIVEAIVAVSSGVDFVRGDTNADGVVDLSDALHILSVSFLGSGAFTCKDAADANDDSHVDVADPILILSSLFLGQGTIPAPFPNCGLDWTLDELGCATDCESSLGNGG